MAEASSGPIAPALGAVEAPAHAGRAKNNVARVAAGTGLDQHRQSPSCSYFGAARALLCRLDPRVFETADGLGLG